MTDISTLTVGLDDRAYDITVGRGLIGRIDEIAGAHLDGRHVVIIADDAVAPHHLPPLQAACQAICRRCDSLTVASGEASKSMRMLAGLLDDILALAQCQQLHIRDVSNTTVIHISVLRYLL